MSFLLNKISIILQIKSRKTLQRSQGKSMNESSIYRVDELSDLHHKINEQIKLQQNSDNEFIYFGGYPYQGLDILGVFGARPTEYRYLDMGLDKLINIDDTILDIGGNCGFMLTYTIFRKECIGTCIDHNVYMINIGKLVSKYLRVDNNIEFINSDFKEFNPSLKYSVIFSFASHWTDDGGYRVHLFDHLKKIYAMLKDGGKLIFETHTTDVGNPEFISVMEDAKEMFSWQNSKLLDNSTRELFIMYKK